jgi:phage terminase large subunit
LKIQFPAKLSCLFLPKRYKVAHGGRGSGKSWAFAQALLIQASQRPLRILCTREVQKSIKDSVHRLLSDQIQALGMGASFEVLENEIRHANGSLFLFAGLAQHTVESIKSFEGVDRVWIEEAQVVTKRSWDVLTPTIRKDGSEVWVTLNPDMDTDETYVRFVANRPQESDDAFVVQMNWKDNPFFPVVLEKERQDTLRRDPESYDNIWEGVPKRVAAGAIYRNEIAKLYEENRVRLVPYDPLLSVHTVWDLGWADSMAIGFFQRSGAEVRCLDYIEDSYRTLDHYVTEIEKRKWRWGIDFIPHDGAAKDFKTGKSTEESLKAMGRNVKVLPRVSVEEGIKAARLMFPRVYFDYEKLQRLLECLKRYQRLINQRTNEPGEPMHDQYSHGADMFRYAAMAVDEMGNAEAAKPIVYKTRRIA